MRYGPAGRPDMSDANAIQHRIRIAEGQIVRDLGHRRYSTWSLQMHTEASVLCSGSHKAQYELQATSKECSPRSRASHDTTSLTTSFSLPEQPFTAAYE